MSDNIKVVVKVRPLISREVAEKSSYRWRVKNNTLILLDQSARETDTCYTFDKVYDKETKTQEVYDDVAKPIVEAAIAGFNGTIFAYGQTSSGKTYTMTGTEESPGIIPLAVLNLFNMIKQVPDRDFLVRVSYIEIYNETVRDLLNLEKKNIKIQDTLQGGVKVDCSEKVTSSPEEVLECMKEGEANRQTGATNMNEESSRSHSIFQITIESREHIEGEEEGSGCVNVSQLNLVDLAGSERSGQTGAKGIRFIEGTHINKSLSSLALVIKQLSEDPNKFVNYRDSKLTRILQNSLGGNAKTSIVCAVTPASVDETISTLQFANRAKAIKNKPEVNAVTTNATMIQSLTKQLSRMQAELAAKRNLEIKHQELQTRIAGLRKFILNGFGQRSALELGGRRKPVAQRRMTISTLHNIEEDPAAAPEVARFCTPGLKYNPLCMPLSSEPAAPNQGSKLATVPEEARMVTPPPRSKTVAFNNEVIEIDSDDDPSTTPETSCSPYHKCYNESKTPPCVLRKNARHAEKELKDIVEFTAIEKLYTPSVVELLAKLEKNTDKITQLQEEITCLMDKGKEKDSMIQELTNKVKKAEEEVNTVISSKSELENDCKKKDTRLTDLEVMYETLVKKAKTREEELLSLLAEQQPAKVEEIGKPSNITEKVLKNFLNMSKDMSLVHSDNESSIIQTDDNDGSTQLKELVTNVQIELANKNQIIVELEANLFAQKQKFESLESSGQQLQTTIDDFKTKLSNIETENSFLKCTIENLNSTIEHQKKNIENIQQDIQTYNSTIRELQIKLTEKDGSLNLKVDDSTIETMIANEEKFIANNENIQNIIHSFKILLADKTKEINNMKSGLTAENETLREQVKVKENQISELIEEAEELKNQLNDNITVINKLMKVEEDLQSQLTAVQQQSKIVQKQNTENASVIDNLRKQNSEYEIQITNLQINNNELTRALAEKEIIGQDFSSRNLELSNEAEVMIQKIEDLENSLREIQLTNDNLARAVIVKESNEQNISIKNQELTEQILNLKQRIHDFEKDLSENQNKNDELSRALAEKHANEQIMSGKIKELLEQIGQLKQTKDDLEKDLNESLIKNQELYNTVVEKETSEQNILSKNQELIKQIQELSQKIENLEMDMKEKDNLILSASNIDKESQYNFVKTKEIVYKLQNILVKLSEETDNLPESFEDLDALFDTLNTKLNLLDSLINKAVESASDLQSQVLSLETTRQSDVEVFGLKIIQLENQLKNETSKLSEHLMQTIKKLEDRNIELGKKTQDVKELENKLAVVTATADESKVQLVKAKDILSKLHTIRSKLTDNTEEIQEISDNYENLFDAFDKEINGLDISVNHVLQANSNLQAELSKLSAAQGSNDVQTELLKLTTAQKKEIDSLLSQIDKKNSELALKTVNSTKQIAQLTEELKATRAELEIKNQDIISLEIKINDTTENNENLRNDLLSKENSITLLHEKCASLYSEMESLQNRKSEIERMNSEFQSHKKTYDELLNEKYAQIQTLEDKLSRVVVTLEEQYKDITGDLKDAISDRDKLLVEILKKASRLSRQCGEDISENTESVTDSVYEHVILALDKIGIHISLLQTENEIERSDIAEMLTRAQNEIEKLTDNNLKLMENFEKVSYENQELLLEVERIKKLNGQLLGASDLLQNLNLELQSKSDEIKTMEEKAAAWKEEFMSYEKVMKQQMTNLISENENLKENHKRDIKRSSILFGFSQDSTPFEALPRLVENMKTNVPQSLLTICCNKIIEAIQSNESEYKSTTTSSSKSLNQVGNSETHISLVDHEKLLLELNKATEENVKLINQLSKLSQQNLEATNLLEELRTMNRFLLDEREEVRKEVQMLIEPASELQKRIANHRTNLSTLTATTYAENKLLNSQLKVLKHHHSRHIHLCQRDLPAFKVQLNELMTILKESSFTDKQNNSFKRYSLPDVLDCDDASLSTFKHGNETTLDGDLLMLDTNITMTTVDNTLVGPDQSCLDVTQVNCENDTSCHTNHISKVIDPCLPYSQIEILLQDNQKLVQQIETLQQQNSKLREAVQKSTTPKDAHYSLIKMNVADESASTTSDEKSLCKFCKDVNDKFHVLQEKMVDELNARSKELQNIKAEKDNIEQKYTNLTLEIPSTEALVRKLNDAERKRIQEVDKLNGDLTKKNKIIKELQEENDTLSTQMMDNISEADHLKIELDRFKDLNNKLTEQCEHFKLQAKDYETKLNSEVTCAECVVKNEFIQSLNQQIEHLKLNTSFSSWDSSSRHNKICTLQSELHASKEDCKKITEEVATIKNHLERSNISVCQMDLDESMGESKIFAFTNIKTENKAPDIKQSPNVYNSDKLDCFNFFIEKVGTGKETFDTDIKIIDVMKMFYNSLVAIHGNEVENLLNKLRDLEDSKCQLQSQLNNATLENSLVTEELKESKNNYETVNHILNTIRDNTNLIKQQMTHVTDENKETIITTLFKENVMKVLDSKFGSTCANVFDFLIDSIVSKQKKDLSEIIERYTKLQNEMEDVVAELKTVSENLKQIKQQLSNKENEFCLLKTQKERVHEISKAVTLDLVKKENELREILVKGCEKLVKCDIIVPYEIDAKLSVNETIQLLFEHIESRKQSQSTFEEEKQGLIFEVNNLKSNLAVKENILDSLQNKIVDTESRLQQYEIEKQNMALKINNLKASREQTDKTVNDLQGKLSESETNLSIQKTLHEEMTRLYDNKVEEIKMLSEEIETLKQQLLEKDELSRQVNALKQKLDEKERKIKTFENQTVAQKAFDSNVKPSESTELLAKIDTWKQDYDNLKSVNSVITKEKETYALKLEKAYDIIAKNKIELEKMTADVLVLRESVNDNVSIIETLSMEAKSLMEQNVQLKKQCEEKNQNCLRLEMNIKTHEKTTEIQSKMIIKLRKQREEDYKASAEKDKQLEDLTEKLSALQKERDELKDNLEAAKRDMEVLKIMKESLDAKENELGGKQHDDGYRRRLSIDVIADVSRRRRQSFHDSKRAFELDSNHIENVFQSRSKPDDLFMDVDEDDSNRSTPIRLSRGRDSFPPRNEIDEELPSRPSSVNQTRRRRQTIHDQHRGPLQPSRDPNDGTTDLSAGDSQLTGVTQLRERLTSCQQELDELKDKYRELDEECEICAQYLRERDDQCSKLRKEKIALELQVAELHQKLKFNANVSSEHRVSFAHAAVNTDEDWANLHSVVVDRMSFDAEVEKNKKLSRTIEELRCNKQELNNTLAKMQRALEKNSAYAQTKELEATKAELATCKKDLEELRERYRELDDECDTCAQYLRERDEQCRKLREAKQALETKISVLQGDVAAHVRQAARRRRQSLHDNNRSPDASPVADAQTEISDDLLSYQVERDDNALKENNTEMQELNRIKMTLEKVLREKAALENQLTTAIPAANPTMYVATGSAIVQNQQITDVMRENQKLKKLNAKLITICKKRKALDDNRENEEPSDLG